MSRWRKCAAPGKTSAHECPDEWAKESISDACDFAYKYNDQWITDHEVLDGGYYTRTMPVVERRLAQAGVRMAALLNDVLPKLDIV